MTQNPRTPFTRSAAPTHVAVLSPDALLGAMLTSLLQQRDDLVVGPQADADVLLWDPGVEPHRVASQLSSIEERDTPTVVLLPDASYARAALDAGAAAVLLRDRVDAGLGDALVAARNGLTVLDTGLASTLFPSRMSSASEQPAPVSLTQREHEVLGLLAEGLSNRRIAKRLEISEHTAKFHVNRILLKLDADTRTEAVVTALRSGLLML